MGADGGVVYIPLKNPTHDNYARVCQLLQPFWQFQDQDSSAYWAEAANWEWQKANPNIGAPHEVLGYYGTDRGDNFDLSRLPELCEMSVDYHGDLYALTFDELDMDCRTSLVPITGAYHEPILYRLWYRHFHLFSREEVLRQLGIIANMTAAQWAKELDSLLELSAMVTEETWT